MGKFFLFAVSIALVGPMAAESMEASPAGAAGVAIDEVLSLGLPPALAILGAALFGYVMLTPKAH